MRPSFPLGAGTIKGKKEATPTKKPGFFLPLSSTSFEEPRKHRPPVTSLSLLSLFLSLYIPRKMSLPLTVVIGDDVLSLEVREKEGESQGMDEEELEERRECNHRSMAPPLENLHDSSAVFSFKKDLFFPHSPPRLPLQTTPLSSQLPADATLQHLRAAVATQPGGGAAAAAGTFLRDGAPLVGAPAAPLASLGVGAGDLLMCVPDPQQQGGGTAAALRSSSAAAAAAGGIPDAAAALAALRADPAAVARLPLRLQEAVRLGDLETLGAAIR